MKLVRLTVVDGREYLGLLGSVDKTGALFIQDALEVHNLKDPKMFHHDLYTPYMLRLC